MTNSPENGPTYLDAVGQILYESTENMSDAEHHALIVERGINRELDTEHRAIAYDYARTHISDPEILAETLLGIAWAGVNGIAGNDRYDDVSEGRKAENQARFNEGLEVAKEVVEGGLLTTDELVTKGINLILNLETKDSGEMKDHGEKDAYGRQKSYQTGIFAGKFRDKVVAHEQSLAHHALTTLAVACLDTIRVKFPNVAKLFSDPLHKKYMQQLERVPGTQEGDHIIQTILDLVDANTQDAVTDALSLRGRTKEQATKRAVLDRAIDLTAQSDRTRHVVRIQKEGGRRLLGLLKPAVTGPEEKPSLYDQRLGLLRGELSGYGGSALKGMLDLYPDYIRKVVELFPEREQGGVWEFYAEEVARIAFDNGSYKISEIGQIMQNVQTFGEIAPHQIANQAEMLVKQRLAQSSPSTK